MVLRPKEQRMIRFLRLIPLALALISAVSLSRPDIGSAAPPPVQSFDIVVSLEWEPGRQDAAATLPASLATVGCPAEAQPTYLDDLKAGLTDASRYLYAYSRGRFALGTVTVATDGARWDEADIRILADSSYRPTANVGGIVTAPIPNPVSATGVSVTFYPGATTLGRFWDGRGSRCGAWSQPEAWRTIGHEWGHYALFLWDGYYEQFTLREQYCTTTDLPRLDLRRHERSASSVGSARNSVMSYHYTADRLWESGLPAECSSTPQMRINATSDWETIRRFYPSIGSPDEIPTSPAPLPAFVFESTAPTEYTTARVKAEGFSAPDGVARSYLVRGAGSSQPFRILGEGELLQSEQTTFFGSRPSQNDRAHIALENWANSMRSVFPSDPDAVAALATTPDGSTTNLVLAPGSWRPALRMIPRVRQLTPTTSELLGLRLQIEDCSRQTKQIQVVLCPAGKLCYNQQILTVGSGGQFTASINLASETGSHQSESHGYLYLRSLDTGEEIISTYQVGGGAGSGHIGAHPPLLDGQVLAETPEGNDPPTGQDIRVLWSTALVCQAPILPQGVLSIVGNPVDLQPAFADQQEGRPWGSLPSDPPLAVRLSYSQDLLDRLGVDERSLVLLRANAQGVWEVVPTAGQSQDLDWIAGAALALDGNGALYAIGAAESRVMLPLVVK
jgi:hypothetical protein